MRINVAITMVGHGAANKYLQNPEDNNKIYVLFAAGLYITLYTRQCPSLPKYNGVDNFSIQSKRWPTPRYYIIIIYKDIHFIIFLFNRLDGTHAAAVRVDGGAAETREKKTDADRSDPITVINCLPNTIYTFAHIT